jgi:hypothetical protein
MVNQLVPQSGKCLIIEWKFHFQPKTQTNEVFALVGIFVLDILVNFHFSQYSKLCFYGFILRLVKYIVSK